MTQISNLPAHKARNLIGQKKLSSFELVKSFIEQYEKHNPNINAIVAFDQKDVLEQAKKCDVKVSKGETLGLLHGLPVGIKDLQMVKNLRSTYGSLLFKNHIQNMMIILLKTFVKREELFSVKRILQNLVLALIQKIEFMEQQEIHFNLI